MFNLATNDRVGLFSDNGQNELAVAYSIADTKVDEFYARNSADFKTPEMVSHLPRRVSLNSGERFVPEIVGSSSKIGNTDYYDGTKKLNLRGETN